MSTITFTSAGFPYSPVFDDIYFDEFSTWHQSQQIFIDGNDLAKKFRDRLLIPSEHSLVIGETGFGTGLNFLLAWRCYDLVVKQLLAENLISQQQLNQFSWHFISVEKFPLSQQELSRSLKNFPELQNYANALTELYPLNIQHSTSFLFNENNIKLTLLIDDAEQAFKQYPVPPKGIVDCWFLDGFSPEKNPDMWRIEVFEQLARLSKPQASLATFTVAGFVRRGLKEVGFRLQKHKSNSKSKGKKSEFLIGKYQQTAEIKQKKRAIQGYKIRTSPKKPQHVSIIGGGIASACLAHTLTQQGVKVTLYCKDNEVAMGASSNAVGAIYPLIRQRPDSHSHFYQRAFDFALNFYQQLHQSGYAFDHQWCGLLDLSYSPSLQQRQHKFDQYPYWPKDLIYGVNATTASKISGVKLPFGGLYMPRAGWIAPKSLVNALLLSAQSTNRFKLVTNCNIHAIKQCPDNTWTLESNLKQYHTNTLIVCAGADSIKLSVCDPLPLSTISGQVTQVAATEKSHPLKTVICHKGYITPAVAQKHCIGATFNKNSLSNQPEDAQDIENLTTIEQCIGHTFDWTRDDILSSNMRSRCMTPDHLPIVGALPNIKQHQNDYAHLSKDKNWPIRTPAQYVDNLYVLTGLGARGLCSAPILAEILAAELCNHPYPVDDDLLFTVAANRFEIKRLIYHANKN